MDQETLLIEALSAEDKIIDLEKQVAKQNIKRLISAVLLVLLFFCGIGTLVYRGLTVYQHSMMYMQRLRILYLFSMGSGIVFAILLSALALFLWLRVKKHQHDFPVYLKEKLAEVQQYEIVYQDDSSYYLAETALHPPQRTILKKNTYPLTETMEEQEIMLGTEANRFGIIKSRLFLKDHDPAKAPIQYKQPKAYHDQRLLYLTAGILIVGAVSAYTYIRNGVAPFEPGYDPTSSSQTVSSSKPAFKTDSTGLAIQNGPSPTHTSAQTNELYLDGNTNELFQTTDGGGHWTFVPLKTDWLRFGSYTLTAGEIPYGYWMDKTFQIAPDFTWYLYADSEKVMKFLSSVDNGQRWRQSEVLDQAGGVRYRKGMFFNGSSGLVAIGTHTEYLTICTTNDGGATWNKSGSAQIPQPIQNVSFISQMEGFVSTREELYYTKNGGNSYKQAVVSIPEEYIKGGLDLFQSPNEVTQVSSDLLEAKFYLTKKPDAKADAGRMFACLYQSTDGGETWQFREQLSEVKQGD